MQHGTNGLVKALQPPGNSELFDTGTPETDILIIAAYLTESDAATRASAYLKPSSKNIWTLKLPHTPSEDTTMWAAVDGCEFLALGRTQYDQRKSIRLGCFDSKDFSPAMNKIHKLPELPTLASDEK